MAAWTAFRSLCHHTCLKAGAAFGMALFMMTLSPPTAAQVSTGGVIPPADDPHFGWIPQPKPYDSQYPYLSTFDGSGWT